MRSRHAAFAMLVALAATGCSETDPAEETAPPPLANTALIPTVAASGYLGRWAAAPQACRSDAWLFERARLTAPGGVDCAIADVEEAAAGWGLDVSCRTEAGASPGRLTVALIDPLRPDAITVQGADFARSVRLVRCP